VNVLAFGAHPDDVDLYAGGLVATLARRGARVKITDLTRGELGTRGTPEVRAEEARRAAEILGVARECLSLPDGRLDSREESHVRAVVEAMRRHAPDLVLSPWERDLHPDHREAALLIRRARFLARLPKFASAGVAVRPGPIFYYEQKIPFEPDLIVDVTGAHETKLQAIRAFSSQFSRAENDPLATEVSEPEFHEMLRARSRAHGARIGVVWGEGYRREEPQAVLDPLVLMPMGERT
jgi:bacillithiol biosynthesis deacetylase BshB1